MKQNRFDYWNDGSFSSNEVVMVLFQLEWDLLVFAPEFFIYIYTYVYMCICVNVYMCICIYVYMCICIYEYICIHMYICIYICIYVLYNPLWEHKQGHYLSQLYVLHCTILSTLHSLYSTSTATLVTVLATWRHLQSSVSGLVTDLTAWMVNFKLTVYMFICIYLRVYVYMHGQCDQSHYLHINLLIYIVGIYLLYIPV